MIYLTGDCHGDYRRFSTSNFPEQKEMNKNDYVIVAGDFGIWDDSKEQKYWFKWLDEKPFTILFVDGNHENFDLLKTYPEEIWMGGKVQKINDSIIHLMRGEIYDIDGCRIFTFGGASSHDISGGILQLDDPQLSEKEGNWRNPKKPYRIEHLSWWKEELPSLKEMQEGRVNLKKHGNQVTYIVSHCASSSTQKKISDMYEIDSLTNFFDEIKETIQYKKWFFGHYHDNQKVSDSEFLLYEQIIRIW